MQSKHVTSRSHPNPNPKFVHRTMTLHTTLAVKESLAVDHPHKKYTSRQQIKRYNFFSTVLPLLKRGNPTVFPSPTVSVTFFSFGFFCPEK